MEDKKSWFQKLKQGLSKTRDGVFSGVFAGNNRVTEDFYEELEEAMIMADIGMNTTQSLLASLRAQLKEAGIRDTEGARTQLRRILADAMRPEQPFVKAGEKAILLMVGVNGVGKTTSAGKLAYYYAEKGVKPMLAAADTFRAAAAEQITVWAGRAGAPIVKHGEGADPAAVVYDAAASYKAKGRDMLICDTAGRLHNKKNLMDELAKIRRVIARELPGVRCESLLVLDATTGQNAVAQAKVFSSAAELTGVVLTKLDGTAKGGVVVAVKGELGLPVRFVGVGEGVDDLQAFDPDAFAEALI